MLADSHLCLFLQKKKLKRQREAEEDELEIPPRYQGEVSFLFVGQTVSLHLHQAGEVKRGRQSHEVALT